MENNIISETTVAFCIILLITHFKESNSVSWNIKTTPVVNGKSVELFCNTSKICEGCNMLWHRESDGKLLTFDGASNIPSKYTSNIYNNGFSLFIKNFTFNDANETFICTLGFESYKKQLKMDDNFNYYFSEQEIMNLTNNSSLYFNVEFEEAYPFLNCSFFSKDTDSTSNMKEIITSQTLFVFVSITKKGNESSKPCAQPLHTRCLIESRNINVIFEDKRQYCLDGKKNEEEMRDRCKSFPYLMSVIVFLLCFIIFLMYRILKVKYCNNKEHVRDPKYIWKFKKEGVPKIGTKSTLNDQDSMFSKQNQEEVTNEGELQEIRCMIEPSNIT